MSVADDVSTEKALYGLMRAPKTTPGMRASKKLFSSAAAASGTLMMQPARGAASSEGRRGAMRRLARSRNAKEVSRRGGSCAAAAHPQARMPRGRACALRAVPAQNSDSARPARRAPCSGRRDGGRGGRADARSGRAGAGAARRRARVRPGKPALDSARRLRSRRLVGRARRLRIAAVACAAFSSARWRCI